MNTTLLQLLIIALPPTITGVLAIILSLTNSHKLDQVHVLVNSNLSNVKADLAIALDKISLLQQLISKKAE